jgi:hypothetical protein
MIRNPGLVYRVIAFTLVASLAPWPGIIKVKAATISSEDDGIEESVETEARAPDRSAFFVQEIQIDDQSALRFPGLLADAYRIDYPGKLTERLGWDSEETIEIGSQLDAHDRFRAYTVADLRIVANGGDWPATGAARLYDMDSSDEVDDSKDKSDKKIKVTIEWKRALIMGVIGAVLFTGILLLWSHQNS